MKDIKIFWLKLWYHKFKDNPIRDRGFLKEGKLLFKVSYRLRDDGTYQMRKYVIANSAEEALDKLMESNYNKDLYWEDRWNEGKIITRYSGGFIRVVGGSNDCENEFMSDIGRYRTEVVIGTQSLVR